VDADAATRGSVKSARHLPSVAAYAAITIALTWPVAAAPGRTVAFDLGDPLLTASILWWNAQQLPFTEAWWTGTFFFPASDSLALSDHRVGISLLTTPLMWLGVSSLAAYGSMFLLTWWLSATAAYALVWPLTSNRAAAFIAGLVFGFNPFRAAHLPHLELLASYWLPVTLLALHRWLDTRRNVWLYVLAVAQLMQMLTSGYYFFFMAVLVGLWLVWFARGLSVREYARLGAALVVPLLLVAPVLAHYRQAHDAMGLKRSIDEIEQLSADLLSFVTVPEPLALWRSPESWSRPEGELMPGLVAVLLVIAGAAVGWRRQNAVQVGRLMRIARRILIVIAAAAIGVAVLPWFVGPIAFDVAGISVTSRGQAKPLGIAFACILAWLVTSRPFIGAFTSRSIFGFYAMAVLTMWLLAMGPEGRVMGHPVLYKPPYAWLMTLPGFEDSFRAPARFAMLAVLALSVAAGVAVARLAPRLPQRARLIAAVVVAVAVLAESWIYPFPVAAAPAALEVPRDVPASAVVLEVPTGVFEDALAMFHATIHQRRTLNGMSGYVPPHYKIVTRAIAEGNLDVLGVFRPYADMAIFDRRDQAGAPRTTSLRAMADAIPLPDTSTHHVTLLPMQPAPTASATPAREEVRRFTMATQPPLLSSPRIDDDDLETGWGSGAPQNGTETITLTLEEPRLIAGVRIDHGPHATAFGRAIAVDVSEDGRQWDTVLTVDGATTALAGALRDPLRLPVVLTFAPRRAAQVRIRQLGKSSDEWVVAELRLLAQ
jgi:hypothetical protein